MTVSSNSDSSTSDSSNSDSSNSDFFFSKNNFNILTTEEIFEGQRFAILAMFFFFNPGFTWPSIGWDWVELIKYEPWLTWLTIWSLRQVEIILIVRSTAFLHPVKAWAEHVNSL